MTVAKDLPITEMSSSSGVYYSVQNQLKRRLPICYMHINYFVHQVRSIGKESFTVEELAAKFNTDSWNREDLTSP